MVTCQFHITLDQLGIGVHHLGLERIVYHIQKYFRLEFHPYLGIGILEEPIVCTMERGYITRMEGGPEADRLREYLSSFGDHNCFNVAELGVGLNPNARLTGEMLEDEGVLGTIHIGIGTSHTLGGEIVAPTHYDLLMWEPTIEVDGRVVQQDKEVFG